MGAIAPDIPFALLFAGTWLYGRWWLGWDTQTVHDKIHYVYFFESPWWVYPHNALHAPLVLASLLLLTGMGAWLARLRRAAWYASARACMWFVIAASLHSLIDIFTHAGDGPLLGFPFNMSYRFQSAVSYWNPAQYGGWFMGLEIFLDGILIVYLWQQRRTMSNT